MSDATLIIECGNEACRDSSVTKDGEIRNCFGRREWTADFNVVTGEEGTSYYAPADGDTALQCPECGQRGAVFSY